MATFYVWRPYEAGSGVAFAHEQHGLSREQKEQILLGERLVDPPDVIELYKIYGGALTDNLSVAWCHMVWSKRLLTLVDASGPGEIQYIPARLVGFEVLQYWIANIITRVSCFDLEHSEYETLTTPELNIVTVSKLVLRPLSEETPSVFRIGELPEIVLVREDLCEAILEKGYTVGEFVEIDMFRI